MFTIVISKNIFLNKVLIQNGNKISEFITYMQISTNLKNKHRNETVYVY